VFAPPVDAEASAPGCGPSTIWIGFFEAARRVVASTSDVQVRLHLRFMEASVTDTKWIKRWKTWIAAAPTLPGVWRRKEGGFLVRGRAIDPRTGKTREIQRVLAGMTPGAAHQWLCDEIDNLRAGVLRATSPKPRFCDFAASLLEKKVEVGEIKSAAGREKWGYCLTSFLIPAFGAFFVDRIHYADIDAWHTSVGNDIRAERCSPHTANGVLGVLRVIWKAAVLEFDLPRNPMDGIKDFDTSVHAAYTEEEPNSLTPDQAKQFLAAMRELYSEHFAMAVLGFATGLRPSSLRCLRRHGPTPDVLWNEGALLVRRSHSRGDEVMNTTKTKRHQRIDLPVEVVDILRWHVEQLPDGPMSESELLFPSTTGGFRSRSVLDKPFRDVADAMGLSHRFTPRGMRRTFQDLARAAEVNDVVTRAISGHATEAMQRHYSTVRGDEVRTGLAKVITLAGLRDARSGGKSGGTGAEPEKEARVAKQ
jgi:hypothetical protein